MSIRLRDANGRYLKRTVIERDIPVKEEVTKQSLLTCDLRESVPKFSLLNLLKLILFLMILSPWIYFIYKKGLMNNILEYILNFLENFFKLTDKLDVKYKEKPNGL